NSVIDTLLAMSVIPMAVVGGIFGLVVMDIPFSVSAAIGFIALFGISVMDGIIIMSQYNQLIRAGLDRTTAVLRTGDLQMRPLMRPGVMAGVGRVPAAISSAVGWQGEKPVAVVVVGGMTLAPFVILITLPVLISLFSRAFRRSFRAEPIREPAE